MKNLMWVAMALCLAGCGGCTTMRNVARMNRELPQMDALVRLKAEGQSGVVMLCGESRAEIVQLVDLAKTMGFQLDGGESLATLGTDGPHRRKTDLCAVMSLPPRHD